MQSALAAEEAVLGSILLENPALHMISDIVRPEDFSILSYRDIYSTMLDLGNEGSPIDATTLATRGHEVNSILALMDAVATADNIEHYAKLVREASQKIQLGSVSAHIRDLSESDKSAEECVLEAEKLVLSIRSHETMGRTRDVGDLCREVCEIVDERMEKGSGFFGHRTGLQSLDDLTGGLQDGEIMVLAGRPSAGKSSVATQILINKAREGGHCVFFSLEMSHHICVLRMLSQISGLSMSRIKTGRLLPSDRSRLKDAAKELSSLKIWIDDTGAITVPKIRAVCRRIKAESGQVDLVAVDYLQLCGGTEREGRERDVAAASAGLKALAKEFEIPVLELSQLNRSCESRDDKRPRLSDLRESGAIEQDADGVIMVYRDSVYNRDAPEDEIELIVRKNRNGPLGTASVRWSPECMRVSDE